MFMEGSNYRPSMASFLNRFSNQCRNIPPDKLRELKTLFEGFVNSCSSLPLNAHLQWLRMTASSPQPQAKYTRTENWLNPLAQNWKHMVNR